MLTELLSLTFNIAIQYADYNFKAKFHVVLQEVIFNLSTQLVYLCLLVGFFTTAFRLPSIWKIILFWTLN